MQKTMSVNSLIFFLKDLRKRTKGANGNEIHVSLSLLSTIIDEFGDTQNDDGTVTLNQKRIEAERAASTKNL